MKPLYPLWKMLFPNYVTTTECVGRAMLSVTKQGFPKPVLENRDINSSCLGFDKRSDEALPVGECTRQPGKLSSNSFALTIKCDGSQFPPKHHLVRKLQITASILTV